MISAGRGPVRPPLVAAQATMPEPSRRRYVKVVNPLPLHSFRRGEIKRKHASYLVGSGRAEWVDAASIRLNENPDLWGLHDIADFLQGQRISDQERLDHSYCRRCRMPLPGEQAAGHCESCRSGGSARWVENRRNAIACAKGWHTQKQWAVMLEACGSACVKCGSHDSVQRDHIRPICAGGDDWITNIQPLCWECNRKKSRSEADFRPERIAALAQELHSSDLSCAAKADFSEVPTSDARGMVRLAGEAA